MFASKPSRLAAALAAVALLALPAASHAGRDPNCDAQGACSGSFDTGPGELQFQTTIPCLTSEEGAADATGREFGHWNFAERDGRVATGHWHFASRYNEYGRIDFPVTGVYVLYTFDAQGGGDGGARRTTITFGGTGQFRGVVYNAAGEPTGQTVTDHSLVRFTFVDSGDAGIPGDSDPTDYFLVDIDRHRWSCS
jgi:YD repeat-containing protein